MVFISFPTAIAEDINDENSYLLRSSPHLFEQQDFALQTFSVLDFSHFLFHW